MGKIDNAIELVKASWGVLRNDKELLVLPVISGACALAVLATFAYPVVTLTMSANEGIVDEGINYPPAAIVLAFVGYFAVTFVGIFFNSALIHAANERMEGGDPTVGSALRGAWARVGRIAAWALVATTVSVAIRQLQERLGIFGRILAFLAGTAWAVVTFLVLPVLVIEDLGPVDSVKRSATLLKRSWGEGLAGHLGLGILNVLVFVFLAGVVALSALAAPVTLYGVLPLVLMLLVLSVVVMSALSTVFQTALYRHANGLQVSGFDQQLMNNAFTRGKNWSQPRPSRPSDLRQQQYLAQGPPGATPPPPPPPADLSGPQDWSKLPEGWGSGF